MNPIQWIKSKVILNPSDDDIGLQIVSIEDRQLTKLVVPKDDMTVRELCLWLQGCHRQHTFTQSEWDKLEPEMKRHFEVMQ